MTKPKKIAGVDVLLEVENAQGEFVVVGGQTGASLSREREEIDTTDKTSNGWSSAIPGLGSWSVEGEGFVQLNDNSFDLIEDAFMKGKEVRVNIRMGASNNSSGRNYTGYGYILDLPLDFAQDAAVTFTLTIRGNGELKIVKGFTDDAPIDGGGDIGVGLNVEVSDEVNGEGQTEIVVQVNGYSALEHLEILDPNQQAHYSVDILRFVVTEAGNYTFKVTDNGSGQSEEIIHEIHTI